MKPSTERKAHAAILKVGAYLSTLFPPKARRGGRRKGPEPSKLFQAAVLLFDFNRRSSAAPAPFEDVLDMLGDELERGFAECDADVFRALAKACDHAADAGHELTAHAAHVIAAKKSAAMFFERGVTPTRSQVKTATRAILKAQGRPSYPMDAAQNWTPIFRDAGLGGLPRGKAVAKRIKHRQWDPRRSSRK